MVRLDRAMISGVVVRGEAVAFDVTWIQNRLLALITPDCSWWTNGRF